MANGATNAALSKNFHALYRVGAIGGLTDGQLLERFVAGGNEIAEAAFTLLAERHGPMVLRICRQMLGDAHDADDAFQATFLVLVRKADSVHKRDSLASWLHGVARRVAQRAKSDAARRRIHEHRGAALAAEVESPGETDRPEAWPELHEEIARLPARYRDSVVLCYLEGLSTEAAAERLGCPRGTILSRLSRARDQLRSRLTRRGVTLPAGLLAAGMSAETATAALPAALLEESVRASLSFAERPATGAVLASTQAVALARGVLFAMTISKLKTLGAVTLMSVLALGGAQTFAYQLGGVGGGKPSTTKPEPGDRQAALASAVEKLQAELDASTRRNAELQKELQQIRAELKTLRAAGQEGAANKIDAAASGKTQAPAKVSGAMVARLPGNLRGGGPNEPTYMRHGAYIFAISPIGDKVSIYNTVTDKAKSIRLSASKEAPLSVVPVFGNTTVTLMLKGSKISEIAVFCLDDERWYRQDLREPVVSKETPIEGKLPVQVSPIVGQSVVACTAGRFIYAFSVRTKHWSVLEVPEGVNPFPTVSSASVALESNGHVYEFRDEIGEWNDIDIRALVDTAVAEEKEDPKPQP